MPVMSHPLLTPAKAGADDDTLVEVAVDVEADVEDTAVMALGPVDDTGKVPKMLGAVEVNTSVEADEVVDEAPELDVPFEVPWVEDCVPAVSAVLVAVVVLDSDEPLEELLAAPC